MKDSKSKLVPIRIPNDLVQAIDKLVGKGRRSKFIIHSSQKELIRQQQLAALKESFGAWDDDKHPELPATVAGLREYLRRSRLEAEQRGNPR